MNRRCRGLPPSVTSSVLVPEKDTSWMRGALMMRKECNWEKEIKEGEECDSSCNTACGSMSSGKGDRPLVTTTNHG